MLRATSVEMLWSAAFENKIAFEKADNCQVTSQVPENTSFLAAFGTYIATNSRPIYLCD